MPIFHRPGSTSYTPEEEKKKQQEYADLLTQIIRGGTYGLTAGLYQPMSDAGEGGIPEQLARIVGLGAGLGFPGVGPARLAGMGVAGLAKAAPGLGAKLLRPGVAAGEAAWNMGKIGRQIGPSFKAPGAALSLGAGVVGQSELEEIGETSRGEEPRSLTSRLATSALGATLGGLGGRALSRQAGRKLAEAAVPAAGVAAEAAEETVSLGFRTLEQKLERIAQRRLEARAKFEEGQFTELELDRELKRLEKIERRTKEDAYGPVKKVSKKEREREQLYSELQSLQR